MADGRCVYKCNAMVFKGPTELTGCWQRGEEDSTARGQPTTEDGTFSSAWEEYNSTNAAPADQSDLQGGQSQMHKILATANQRGRILPNERRVCPADLVCHKLQGTNFAPGSGSLPPSPFQHEF